MSALLTRHTPLPVREAVAGESLEVDHIDLMPAGVCLRLIVAVWQHHVARMQCAALACRVGVALGVRRCAAGLQLLLQRQADDRCERWMQGVSLGHLVGPDDVGAPSGQPCIDTGQAAWGYLQSARLENNS
ncbi:MAG: hypothetical protein QE285_11830 [Aquabacterium sp.]|nr:hypothetical protein [Aquabacterium sp.]